MPIMGDETGTTGDVEMRPVSDASDGGKRLEDKKTNLQSDADNTTSDVKNAQEVNGEVSVRPRGRPRKVRQDENADKNDTKMTRTRKRAFSESDDEAKFRGFEPQTSNLYPGLQIINKLLESANIMAPSYFSISDIKNLSSLPTKRIRRPTVKVLENADTEASEVRTRHSTESESAGNAQKQDTDESDADAGLGLEMEADRDEAVSVRRGRRSSTTKSGVKNEAYKKPFEQGWKRELVYRGVGETSQVKTEKIKTLTTENFTFTKELIGVKKPMEMAREAGSPGLQHFPENAVANKVASPAHEPEASKSDNQVQKKVAAKRGRPRLNPKSDSASENDTTPSPPKNKPAEVQNDAQTSTPKKGVLRKEPIKSSPMTRRSQQNQQPSETEPMDISAIEEQQTSVTEKLIKTNKRVKRKKTPVTQVTTVATDVDRRHIAIACSYYDVFPRVFQYLTVQELLRVSRVCRMWRDLAAHPSLWRTVRMKNSPITDWDGFAEALNRYKTQHLDLRKIIMPEGENIWAKFVEVLPKIKSLKNLKLCRCPGNVVEAVIENCPQLETFSAMSIKCDAIDIKGIKKFNNCTELRLKAITGMTLSDSMEFLSGLTQLKHLSLTSVKELGRKDIHLVKKLVNLEVLELGECSDLPANFGTDIIANLPKLERLRLEKGQGTCNTFNILEGVSQSPNLSLLELVNFDIKKGFDAWLAKCTNIKRLLIIPTYISQSATTNHMILGGVTQLKETLTNFVWGVTLELLRVTDLFVDQCPELRKRIKGDAIPVLKPIPCAELIEDMLKDAVKNADNNEFVEMERRKCEDTSNPEVDILTLLQLQKLLLLALPTTRVKILKIPFHATWRQSLLDSAIQ